MAAAAAALRRGVSASRVAVLRRVVADVCQRGPGPAPAFAPPAAQLWSSAAARGAAGLESGVHHLGPSVKILLEGAGLDPNSIPHTGPHGVLTKGDVLQAISKGGGSPLLHKPPSLGVPPPPPSLPPPPPPPKAAASPSLSPPAAPPRSPAAAAAVTPPPRMVVPPPAAAAMVSVGLGAGLPPSQSIPTTQLRKIIAQRLLESKLGSPHFYAEAEAIIDQTLALRKHLKESMGVSVSVNDFIIKAAAAALQHVPEANVMWDEKAKNVVPSPGVDICVAVATEKGLFTPIVKAANTKSLSAISAEVKDLAARARLGKLLPEEYQGGCFSISNLGMFPIDRFSAIINPPQPCILAVGRGERVLRWPGSAPPSSADAVPEVVTKMEVTLSADARAIGADVAGKFLAKLCAFLKDPIRLIV